MTVIFAIMQSKTSLAAESFNSASGNPVTTVSVSSAEIQSASEDASVSEDSRVSEDSSVSENVKAEDDGVECVSAKQLEVSEELLETVGELSGLRENVDYEDDQAYFEADSMDEARKVAEDYGAELDSFDYGIGVIKFEERSVTEALTETAQSCSADTVVYPEYIQSTEAVSVPNDTSYNLQ